MVISTLFKEFEQWSAVQGTTKRKCKFAIRKLIDFTSDIEIAEVTMLLCSRFQSVLSTQMRDASVQSFFAAASQVFAWSVQQKHLAENPFTGVKKIRYVNFEVRTYRIDEITDLLEAVTAIHWQDRTATMRWTGFFLCGLHGMRAGEIWNLRWDDIDLDEGIIRVQYRPDRIGEFWCWQSKSRTEGEIPINQELWDCLSRMQVIIDWRYPFLKRCTYQRLTGQIGSLTEFQRKAPYNNFHREMNKIKQVANRKRAIEGRKKIAGDFHMLRKTAGTHLAEQGVPMHFTKTLLRQSSIKTTTAYYIAVDKKLCRQQGRAAFNNWAR